MRNLLIAVACAPLLFALLSGCAGTGPSGPRAPSFADLKDHLPSVGSPLVPMPFTGVLRSYYSAYGIKENANPGPANLTAFSNDKGVLPTAAAGALYHLARPVNGTEQVMEAFALGFASPAAAQAWFGDFPFCSASKVGRYLLRDGATVTMVVVEPPRPVQAILDAAAAAKQDVMTRLHSIDLCA